MWDEFSDGKLSWGPEEWGFDKVEALCSRLLRTCLAMILALSIFGLNYRQLAISRGWIPKDLISPKLRFEELRQLFNMFAGCNSMSMIDLKIETRVLRVVLETQPRGVDQAEEILVGGDNWSRAYEKPVKYIETLEPDPGGVL